MNKISFVLLRKGKNKGRRGCQNNNYLKAHFVHQFRISEVFRVQKLKRAFKE